MGTDTCIRKQESPEACKAQGCVGKAISSTGPPVVASTPYKASFYLELPSPRRGHSRADLDRHGREPPNDSQAPPGQQDGEGDGQRQDTVSRKKKSTSHSRTSLRRMHRVE